MLGINSSTCRTEKCVGAELRSKVNFLNEIEIAADGLFQDCGVMELGKELDHTGHCRVEGRV